jgi:hypothetical protein
VSKQETKEETPTRPADYEHGKLLNPTSRAGCEPGLALVLALTVTAIGLGQVYPKGLQRYWRNYPSGHHNYVSCSPSLACTHHQHR